MREVMKETTLASLALLLILAAGRAEEPAPPAARIDTGPITGKWVGEDRVVRAFLGIPYAAPPVGNRRWRPPAPAAAWREPRDCTSFGPACPQPDLGRHSRGIGKNQSEDCLYLNVWAPATPGKETRPVMVWIHGGGMVIGAGSLSVYDGANFARRGVVLVTINYRLGPFGFFGHPWLSAENEEKVSGNFGLLDQIAALEWVKRNAAAFGGDPERVTIFGESAGAVSVTTLMACPRAKGLFHGAIAQSGTAEGVTLPLRSKDAGADSLERRGVALAERLGAKDLKALRALPAKRLLAAANPAPVTLDRHRRYGPVVDGVVLPEPPSARFAAGRQLSVPLILGSNADDGSVFTVGNRVRSVLGYRIAARTFFGKDAERVRALFPVATDEQVRDALRDVVTVWAFTAPARRMARNMEKVPARAWLYHFRRVSPPAKRFGVGAAHGIEIPYVFGNVSKWTGLEKIDFDLSRKMQGLWIRFAETGDPNGEGLPEWPAYEAKTDLHLDLGDVVKIGSGLRKKECDLFDALAAKRRPAGR